MQTQHFFINHHKKYFSRFSLLLFPTAYIIQQRSQFTIKHNNHKTTTTNIQTKINIDWIINYRHVILPKELAKTLPKTRLLSENEWRSIGVQQSRGWQHYAIHRPEPHILLFRRPLGTDPQSGMVDVELKRMALEENKGQFGLRGN